MIRQKSIVLAAVVMVALTVGSYVGYREFSNSKHSDLVLANVEALSELEAQTPDTGPEDTFDCKKCGVTVKICESKNFHSCTPNLCTCYKD